jgi:hypothetical protein
MQKNYKKSVAIDFDGVINSYKSGFVAMTVLPDPPVPGALEAIRNYINAGLKVYIYSTRNRSEDGKEAILRYLEKHGLEKKFFDEIEMTKSKPIAVLYIDDRGYQFTGNNWPSTTDIQNFKPWTKRESSSATAPQED